jgi:hypothetical protein
MTDLMSALRALHRPKLLIRAARLGLEDYVRERDLRRIVRSSRLPAGDAALRSLMDEEARLEDSRRTGGAGYSIGRHVEVLVAMLAEARLLRRTRPDAA